MCWVSMAPAAFASRWKRLISMGFRDMSPELITLTATRLPVPVCSASNTDPIAPAPRRRMT
jgi:hypothetical protein